MRWKSQKVVKREEKNRINTTRTVNRYPITVDITLTLFVCVRVCVKHAPPVGSCDHVTAWISPTPYALSTQRWLMKPHTRGNSLAKPLRSLRFPAPAIFTWKAENLAAFETFTRWRDVTLGYFSKLPHSLYRSHSKRTTNTTVLQWRFYKILEKSLGLLQIYKQSL